MPTPRRATRARYRSGAPTPASPPPAPAPRSGCCFPFILSVFVSLPSPACSAPPARSSAAFLTLGAAGRGADDGDTEPQPPLPGADPALSRFPRPRGSCCPDLYRWLPACLWGERPREWGWGGLERGTGGLQDEWGTAVAEQSHPEQLLGVGGSGERLESPESVLYPSAGLSHGAVEGKVLISEDCFLFLPISTIIHTWTAVLIMSRWPHPTEGSGLCQGESVAGVVQSTLHPAELVRDTVVSGGEGPPRGCGSCGFLGAERSKLDLLGPSPSSCPMAPTGGCS